MRHLGHIGMEHHRQVSAVRFLQQNQLQRGLEGVETVRDGGVVGMVVEGDVVEERVVGVGVL